MFEQALGRHYTNFRTEKFNDLILQTVAISMFYIAQVTTYLGKFGIHIASYVGCTSIKAQDGHACLLIPSYLT